MNASRWLITTPATMLREAQHLHVFEDGMTEWSTDPQRALRFAAKHEAERFGADHLLTGFYAEEWATADLVVHAAEPDEVDDDLDEAA